MLTISGNQFLLENKPFRILSGAIHYFRCLPEYWRDRLEKAKAFEHGRDLRGLEPARTASR
jgi:beta-galactosidase